MLQRPAMVDVSRIIPLGQRCRLTHNLRRHYGFTTGYPFDWYILPLKGLLEILRQDLDPGGIYREDLLEEQRDEAGRVRHIRHRRLGIIHEHDFDKEADVVVPHWREQIPRAAARFASLAGRLRERAPGPPPLFVRERHGADKPEQLLALRDALAALQPGGFHLLAVNYHAGTVPGGIPAIRVEEKPGFGWRGDPEAWSAALEASGFRLAAPG